MAGSADSVETHVLQPQHELRLEVGDSKTVYLTAKEGSAEIFGTPLVLGKKLAVRGQKIAVFTWKGCKLEIEGKCDVMYESDETPMSEYLNVHDTLEARRAMAREKGGEGPRCMIVGPTDAGKSTLCKILLNYGVRAGSAQTFVDLDIGQGAITIPGCIAASPVEGPIDVEHGLLCDAPLVYYFGHLTPTDNPTLYRHLLDQLASVLNRRAEKDPSARAAGLIVNSMGWVEDLGYDLLLHSIQVFKADIVVVVGDERLYSQLGTELKGTGINVIKLTKSGGVVTRSREARTAARKSRVEHYFFGTWKELSPVSQTARLGDYYIYRVGGGPKAPTTALPIGATSVMDPLEVSFVSNPKDLLYSMVAVSHAPSADLLLSVNVAGFIYIQGVDVDRGTFTYLTPSGGELPGKVLLMGSYKVYLN